MAAALVTLALMATLMARLLQLQSMPVSSVLLLCSRLSSVDNHRKRDKRFPVNSLLPTAEAGLSFLSALFSLTKVGNGDNVTLQ